MKNARSAATVKNARSAATVKNARSAAPVKHPRSAAPVKHPRSAAAAHLIRPGRDPLTGAARVIRVAVLAGTSLLLAAMAHTFGGGALPGVGVLSACGLALGLLGVVSTTRRSRFPMLLVILVLQQAGLHLLFHATSALHGCGRIGAAHPGMSMPGMTMATCGPATSTAMALGSGMRMGWLMLLAHLGATLLTAALLARGEAWCYRLAQRVVRAAGLGPRRRPTLRRAAALTRAVVRVFGVLETDPAAPRGPPGGLASLPLPA